MNFKKYVRECSRGFFLLALLLIVACALQTAKPFDTGGRDNPANAWSGRSPKYVFLFIGDGMGEEQARAAETYLAALRRNPELPGGARYRAEAGLSFTAFPHRGMISTFSANAPITDSAAAGTALATGWKTQNGVIGLPPSKWGRLPTVAEQARYFGKRVGIVSSAPINHATPAVFYSHASKRGKYQEIGRQLSASGFEYFGGGGFIGEGKNGQTELYRLTEEEGVKVLRERAVILAAGYDGRPVMAVNPANRPGGEMPDAIDDLMNGFQGGLALADFVRKGCQLLENENGFFMMVEGGKIDWAGHCNLSAHLIFEVLEFDLAVREALDFADKHPGETLILVTADHETGGLGKVRPGEKLNDKAIPFDVSERLGGMDDRFARDTAGIFWRTDGHTAVPVPVYALGLGGELFEGYYDNTDIAWKLFHLLDILPEEDI